VYATAADLGEFDGDRIAIARRVVTMQVNAGGHRVRSGE
jgi:hypothetical protein